MLSIALTYGLLNFFECLCCWTVNWEITTRTTITRERDRKKIINHHVWSFSYFLLWFISQAHSSFLKFFQFEIIKVVTHFLWVKWSVFFCRSCPRTQTRSCAGLALMSIRWWFRFFFFAFSSELDFLSFYETRQSLATQRALNKWKGINEKNRTFWDHVNDIKNIWNGEKTT